MPHYSPLPWAKAPFVFFFFLLSIISLSWWHQTPYLNKFEMPQSIQHSTSWSWK